MNKYLTFPLLIFALHAHSQNREEWVNQEKTKIKYLLDQIAACRVYAGSLENGYETAADGLTVIQHIKSGDFFLHSEYFSSLYRVSTSLMASRKVEELLPLLKKIIIACQQQKNLMNNTGLFSKEEIVYSNQVIENLLSGSIQIMNQWDLLTRDNFFQMKDDERIRRIDQLKTEMKDRYAFIQCFGKESRVMALQKNQSARDAGILKTLYNIH